MKILTNREGYKNYLQAVHGGLRLLY